MSQYSINNGRDWSTGELSALNATSRRDSIPDYLQIGIASADLSMTIRYAEFWGVAVGIPLYTVMSYLDADKAKGNDGAGLVDASVRAMCLVLGESPYNMAMAAAEARWGFDAPGVPSSAAVKASQQAVVIAFCIFVAQGLGAALEAVYVPPSLASSNGSVQDKAAWLAKVGTSMGPEGVKALSFFI